MAKELLGSLELNRIYQMDCLEGSKLIEDGSVDLILTDLPYGTVENIGNSENIKHGMKNKTQWDLAIDPRKVYEIANRILRKNGKMILFSQEPYTTRLITEVNANIPFSYRMMWEKDHFANSLIAKKAPVSYYEDVLVFSKTHDTNGVHPLRTYFKSVLDFIGLPKKEIITRIGQRADHTFRTNSTQYGLCTAETYTDIVQMFNINKMNGFIEYGELKQVDDQFKRDLPSTFNLWEGGKYKSNILRYKKDYDGYHPTQKPVLLLEDLIKTFSNEGNIVVDLTCGSGSTCVAAAHTNRNFIGFELESEYVQIANQRLKSIEDTQAERKLT